MCGQRPCRATRRARAWLGKGKGGVGGSVCVWGGEGDGVPRRVCRCVGSEGGSTRPGARAQHTPRAHTHTNAHVATMAAAGEAAARDDEEMKAAPATNPAAEAEAEGGPVEEGVAPDGGGEGDAMDETADGDGNGSSETESDGDANADEGDADKTATHDEDDDEDEGEEEEGGEVCAACGTRARGGGWGGCATVPTVS